jgi:hypothetical protein
MDELAKISRIIDAELPNASKEVLLVLDATTGQNAVNQARSFKDTAGLTALCSPSSTAPQRRRGHLSNRNWIFRSNISVWGKDRRPAPLRPGRVTEALFGRTVMAQLIAATQNKGKLKEFIRILEPFRV